MEFLLDISKVAESGIQSVVSRIVHIRDDHVVSVYIYINVDSFSYAQLCIYIRIAHKMNMCIRYPQSPSAHHCGSYAEYAHISAFLSQDS